MTGQVVKKVIHRYIVVEGPIGVGKTSLARRLTQTLGGELLLEKAEENPFLPKFYQNPRQSALPTQLYFMFQRARQLQALRQQDMFSPVRIADYLMDKDRLFAELTLDEEELKLYDQVYATLTLDAPQPDLVVYLQAPPEVLLERVAKRGIAYERHIDAAYLTRLCDAYTRLFYYYQASPLLIVNTTEIDPVHNENDYSMLVEQVQQVTSGRHYFNPISKVV
jgi:deoxyadenosine/deoxycytidine kinase